MKCPHHITNLNVTEHGTTERCCACNDYVSLGRADDTPEVITEIRAAEIAAIVTGYSDEHPGKDITWTSLADDTDLNATGEEIAGWIIDQTNSSAPLENDAWCAGWLASIIFGHTEMASATDEAEARRELEDQVSALEDEVERLRQPAVELIAKLDELRALVRNVAPVVLTVTALIADEGDEKSVREIGAWYTAHEPNWLEIWLNAERDRQSLEITAIVAETSA